MQEASTFNLADQWRFFLRLLQTRRWTILTFASVTFLVVLIGTVLQTRIYKASATVLIDMEPPSVLTVSTSRDDTTLGQTNYLTYADYYRTQLEVLKSRRVAKKVFKNLKLEKVERFASQKDPVGSLLGHLTVEPIKQTRLVRLSVEEQDPQLASQIANEFALVFVGENLVKSAANEAMTLMKNEYLKLQSKHAELSKRYKAKFPSMVRLKEQMSQLAAAIEKELNNQMGEEQTSNRQLSALEPDPEILPAHQGTFGQLFKQLQENSLMGGLRPNNIRVQDMAQVPIKKSKPKVMVNLMLGLFLGLLGGLAAGCIEELLDGTIKVPKDFERDKRFFFLGHIPRIGKKESPNAVPVAGDTSFYRIMHEKPTSEAAEAYRMIRTNLMYVAPEAGQRTLLFTSPGSGEGKTTTVSNLAIAFSQLGLKVLLVDTDLQIGRAHV